MAAIIYTFCAFAALVCSVLLLRSYARQGHEILLWSGLSFIGSTGSNFMLVIDRLVVPQVDMSLWQALIALLALLPMLYGLIWAER